VSTNAQAASAPRLPYIDALRGVAVVLMILLHAADGWLRPALKDGIGWQVIRTLGGQAAPLFLLLAGMGIGLAWAAGEGKPAEARARARRTLWSRGLEIVLAGYALRLAMWWIDSGTIVRSAGLVGGGLLATGYYVLWQALPHKRTGPRERPYEGAIGLVLGAMGCAYALLYLELREPRALFTLLRPDVLQTIGVAMVLIAVLEPVLRKRPLVACVLAICVALLTSWISSFMPGELPAAIAGYIAPFQPAPGAAPAGRFPLLPWLAHALAGTAFGQALGSAARRPERAAGERAAIEWAVLGALIALVCCESVPETASLLVREPWLTPAVRVAYRIGLSMVLAALCIALAAPRVPGRSGLLALGQASLAVYCVHLEFAFGLAAEPVRKSLGYPAFLFGTGVLIAAMTLFAHVWLGRKDRPPPKHGRNALDLENSAGF
jgi:uncharacterized membrane protein